MNDDNYTGPHRFRMAAWISCAPYEQLLSMEIVRAQDGGATLRMPFIRSYAQGSGLMHGGALVSLADTAVVMAIKSILKPGTHFATISLESRFLHPVKSGIIEARAEITGRRGATINGQCDVVDDADRTVMTFESMFKIAKDAEIKNVSFSDK